MPKFSLITTNFTGGELSPQLAKGRVDIAKYNNGAARLENCAITVMGGLKRRPGSRFVRIEDDAVTVRLMEFIYNRQQAYAIGMISRLGVTYGEMHFYRAGATLTDGGAPVTVRIPYNADQIGTCNYVQKADTAFFAHEEVPAQRLQRFSETQWSFTEVPFITPPFEEQGHNIPVTLLLGQRTPGVNVLVQSSTPGTFLPTDVGRHIIYGGGYALVTERLNDSQVRVEIKTPFPSVDVPAGLWNLEGSPQGDICASNKGRAGQQVSLQANFQYFEPAKAITGFIGGNGTAMVTCSGHGYTTGDTVRVSIGQSFMGTIIVVDSNTFGIAAPEIQGGITTSGTCARATISVGNELFRALDVGKYVVLNGGLIRIDTVVNTALARGTVLRELTSDVPAGPNAWSLESEAWNSVKGYPRSVTISKQRLMYAGSPGYPQNLWASAIQQYLSFQFGTNDDDAFRFELDGPRNSPILHLTAARQLLVLTEADEMSIKGGQEKSVSPTNIQKTDESTAGANYVRPVKVGNEMLFVQAAGKRVMSVAYRFDIDGFSAADRTIFSSHVTGDGITQLAHQKDPDSLLYAVRTDGEMAVCAYDIDQEVTGWSRWITQGAYRSACVVPTAAGEEVYVAVQRNLWKETLPGVGSLVDRWVIEVMDPDMLVDCGIKGSDPAGKATWGGLAHLESREVQCVADGAYMGTFTVSGGQITLPRAAKEVQIGLAFTSTVEMLQPEVGGGGQTAQGSQVNVHEVVVRVLDTRGVEINGKPIDPRRFGANLLDQPPPAFQRDVRAITLQDEIYKTQVVIQQSYPLPFHLLNVVRKVTVNDA